MIVTLTVNPSLDRTVVLDAPLEPGAVQRSLASTAEPGGKGVNVSRAVAAAGGATLALLVGDEHDPVVTGLAAQGVATATVPTGAPIRSNIALVDASGTTTKINDPGTPVTDGGDAVVEAVRRSAASAEWLVLAGSLPPGAPEDLYARVIRAAREAGAARIAVDTSGAPLRAVVAAGARIDLLKPNAEELVDLVGGDAAAFEADPDLVVLAARALLDRGVTRVLVTLGAGGAVLVTAQGALHAVHSPIVPRSTVGAGDCSLAGFLLGASAGDEGALVRAVAMGAAATALPGSAVPTPDLVRTHEVRVRRLAPPSAP